MNFSPNNNILAAGDFGGNIRLYDPETGEVKSTLTVDSGTYYGVQSISYSPAGDMIAAGCYNGKIHILDTVTVVVKRSLTVDCSYSPFYSVAFSPDGSKIAAAYKNLIQIFDAQTQAELGSPLKGTDRVTSVAWNNDGTKLAAGSFDDCSPCTVCIWSVGSDGTFECQSRLSSDRGCLKGW